MSVPGVMARTPYCLAHPDTCTVTAGGYFSCCKVLVESESNSISFLVADVVVAALLLLPITHRHVSA